jgi:hypothetical protein
MLSLYRKTTLDVVGITTTGQYTVRLNPLDQSTYRGALYQGGLLFEFILSSPTVTKDGGDKISGTVRVKGKTYTLSPQEPQSLDTSVSVRWRNIALPLTGVSDIVFTGVL